jgi:hypothetical protein
MSGAQPASIGAVTIEDRQLRVLQALVEREVTLRDEGLPTDFALIRTAGPAYGLNPRIAGEAEIAPVEADFRDLQDQGFVHLLDGGSPSVVVAFALSAAGRSAGQRRAVTPTSNGRPRPPLRQAPMRSLDGCTVSARARKARPS